MKLFTNKKQLQKEIRKFNNINFVPTMGALHRGHESIIRKSVKISGKTLVSIFVNPKQFNNKRDLNTYPRNNKKDIKIFNPDVIIYIDYPGFNLRIAKWAKNNNYTNIYYISPQIWAWKESIIKIIKSWVL